MQLYFELHDHAGVVLRKFNYKFKNRTKFEKLQEKMYSKWKIINDYQEMFLESGKKLEVLGENRIRSLGLNNGSRVIVKHAELPLWIEYKECVELLLKRGSDKVAIAKIAAEHCDTLDFSGFFDVYSQFDNFQREKQPEVTYWTDCDVVSICKATEQYFRNLHDQNRGDEDSEFICYFEKREKEFESRSTNTLAFVQIHGEESVTKYSVKCHHHDGTISGLVPDVTELYCYQLLALIGVGPKSHIIPARMSSGIITNAYIATQWEDKFELLENIIDENTLCGDVVVQLMMISVLFCISDLHERNCGRWKGTKNAAIVDFAPTCDFDIHYNIKSEMIRSFVNGRWREEYLVVRNQFDDNSWLKIAKVYLDKWDISSKIELAREQLDPTNVLLESLEIDSEKKEMLLGPTEKLDDYIDILYKNLENLQNILNSIL